MTQRLALSNDRFKELERRRNMEIEGFKTDIKMLRQKLKYVEKQLFRVKSKRFDRYHRQFASFCFRFSFRSPSV